MILKGKGQPGSFSLKFLREANYQHASPQSKAGNELSHLYVCAGFCEVQDSGFHPQY